MSDTEDTVRAVEALISAICSTIGSQAMHRNAAMGLSPNSGSEIAAIEQELFLKLLHQALESGVRDGPVKDRLVAVIATNQAVINMMRKL